MSAISRNTGLPLLLEEERIDKNDHFSPLPKELILEIFSYLQENWQDIRACLYVNKTWRILVSDSSLWKKGEFSKVFSSLRIIDANDWNTHPKLSLAKFQVNEPPVDILKTLLILSKMSFLSSKFIERDAVFTWLTVPAGLTFPLLVQLAGGEPRKRESLFRIMGGEVESKFANFSVPETYRVFIFNNIFSDTRNQSSEARVQFVKERGCEQSTLFETLVNVILTNIKFEKKLYGGGSSHAISSTYTQCDEGVIGGVYQRWFFDNNQC